MDGSASARLTPDLHQLLAEKARSFSYAARFLPPNQRDATRVLYAYCRTMDDLVDEPAPGVTPADTRRRLGEWRSWLEATDRRDLAPPEPVSLAVALGDVIERHDLPPAYLTALIDGVESDLCRVRMPDFPALRRYCMLVAGVVGLAMCHIVGVRGQAALAAAASLGIAMQLTNVLRDVGGDLQRDRIYLPADELARFGCSEESLRRLAAAGGRVDDSFRALMRFQIARARACYDRGLTGVWLLPPETRTAILSAGRIYRAILDQIERNGYDVLHRRAITSGLVKAREGLAARALVALWGGRPVAGAQTSYHELLDDEVDNWCVVDLPLESRGVGAEPQPRSL